MYKRQIRDRDVGQFGTVTEGFPSYTGDAVRYRDTCQAPAVREGPFPDSIYAIRNRDARQALRVTEGSTLDAGDTIRDRDARQAGAAPKGSTPDAGDGLALDGIRDHQFARGCSFTIGDGDIDVSRCVNKVAEVSSVKWQNCTDTDSKKGLA